VNPAATNVAPALLRRAALFLLPPAVYLAAFCLLTWPLITLFDTHLFTAAGDGLQTFWDLWWVDQALMVRRQSPYFTDLLHHPHGVSLIAQTLHPFDGLVYIPLTRLFGLSPVQAHNAIVVGSFVVGGWTAFALARRLTGHWFGSLAAGYVFTFGSYHFSHAEGHLQLVALEWLPLFLLAFRAFMLRTDYPRAVAAALSMWLVLGCDHYYFVFCVLSGALLGAMRWAASGDALWPLRPGVLGPLAVFAALVAAPSVPLFGGIMLTHARDRLGGAHSTGDFSLDLPAIIIPGGHWRFAEWTRWYWSRLPGNIHESSVHLGVSVLAVGAVGWLGRRSLMASRRREMAAVLAVTLFFLVMALGPRLRVFGNRVPHTPLPYNAPQLLPGFNLSGTPVRMTVMVSLGSALLLAWGLRRLLRPPATPARIAAVAALLSVAVFELLPTPIPATPAEPPGYVRFLMERAGPGAIIDRGVDPCGVLLHQTMHGRPVADGYVTRLPASVEAATHRIEEAAAAFDADRLRHGFGLRYWVSERPLPAEAVARGFREVFRDGGAVVYEIAPGPGECGSGAEGGQGNPETSPR
jgi:hypothetical protein